MRATDILEYSQKFKTEDGKYNSTIYFNDSILHATIIMAELIEKAKSEPNKVLNMYCGKFSLFRDETKAKVDNIKLGCDLTELNDEQREKWANFDSYRDLQTALSEFLGDNVKGRLNLIIERDLNTLKECSVWRTLSNGMEQNRVNIYTLHDNMGLGHFAVTNEAYRLEDSDDNKTACGSFNDKANADVLNYNFQVLKNFSEQVHI